MAGERLVIFVKAPRPGLVKTRLAAVIGRAQAVHAYRRLVGTLLRRLRAISPVELRFAPDDALGEISMWLREGWIARPQGEGDLGQRLQSAFEAAFATGSKRVVIIGSDCPSIAPKDVQSAWAGLSNHDLVLGPAADGGYWLIGLQRAQKNLFQDMVWSTGRVFEETVRRATAANLRLHLLRELRDVDTEEDWKEFQKRPRTGARQNHVHR